MSQPGDPYGDLPVPQEEQVPSNATLSVSLLVNSLASEFLAA